KLLKYLRTLGLKGIERIRVFILDQEANVSRFHPLFELISIPQKEYCKQHNIIVGVPTTMLFYQGQPMLFAKGEWEPSDQLKGMLNLSQLEELCESAKYAANMGLKEIHVPF